MMCTLTASVSWCMLSGNCSSICSLPMPTRMALSSSLLMESHTACSLGSLLIRPIILRSECCILSSWRDWWHNESRILHACVKFLGACPCSCCLVAKSSIPDMGSRADMNTWRNKARISNKELGRKIKSAQKSIFKHRASINGNRMKKLLGEESLVPTRVSRLF